MPEITVSENESVPQSRATTSNRHVLPVLEQSVGSEDEIEEQKLVMQASFNMSDTFTKRKAANLAPLQAPQHLVTSDRVHEEEYSSAGPASGRMKSVKTSRFHQQRNTIAAP